MNRLIAVMIVTILLLPGSLAFAAGKAGLTGPKHQGPNEIDAPRGWSHNQTTFVTNPAPGFPNIPPGWVQGPQPRNSFLHDPNPEPRGFDHGQGFGFTPK